MELTQSLIEEIDRDAERIRNNAAVLLSNLNDRLNPSPPAEAHAQRLAPR
jgi:hypothetical protein